MVKYKTVAELCPHCGSEIILKAKLWEQQCPECESIIKPCALCDTNVVDCNNCPCKGFDFGQAQELLILITKKWILDVFDTDGNNNIIDNYLKYNEEIEILELFHSKRANEYAYVLNTDRGRFIMPIQEEKSFIEMVILEDEEYLEHISQEYKKEISEWLKG